ncbi:MAG: hypothetical protein A6F70_05790 [Cycloclasticus sp. symbiont of Bathymodiolus heckerae]|nr:MAG: hypothetical protein A6F70_05790 [Cycloclasticus sp. symbiont of Bathymodiolus heckerae]
MNTLVKNRLKLVFIATLFAMPVITAWVVFNNPELLEGGKTKNYGELISPAIPSDLSDYIMQGSEDELAELKGRWVLVHVDLDGLCAEACEKSVHILGQLNTLLNKDAKRFKRVYLNKSMTDDSVFLSTRKNLKLFVWGEEQIAKLKVDVKGLVDGDMLLIDPLGNIMMKYSEDANPYGVQKDLKHLFKASQIG